MHTTNTSPLPLVGFPPNSAIVLLTFNSQGAGPVVESYREDIALCARLIAPPCRYQCTPGPSPALVITDGAAWVS